MPRLAVNVDVFHAVAEPQRRRILDLLATGERPVGDIVRRLRISQPLASKHLRVLREVELVHVRGDGQQRLYRLNATRLKPLHEWVLGFAPFWNASFDRLAEYLHVLHTRDPHEPHS